MHWYVDLVDQILIVDGLVTVISSLIFGIITVTTSHTVVRVLCKQVQHASKYFSLKWT